MKFTHIIFDMDMTLFDYPSAQLDAFIGCTKETGIRYTKDIHQIYSDCNEHQWRLLEQNRITIDELQINRFMNFLELIERRDIEPEKINKKYTEILETCGYLIPGVQNIVETLAKEYILAIATNGIARVQRGRLKSSGISSYFRYVFISEEMRKTKPDVGFFNVMLKKMGVKSPENVLMVGDSLLADIAGAVKAGITTCWANYSKAPNHTDIKPDYEIFVPEDILSIIKR